MVRASNLPSPAPISKKKSPWTAVQVTVSKQLMFRKKSLWSDGAGKVAGKLVWERSAACACLMVNQNPYNS